MSDSGENLAERIARLESIEAIRALMADYAVLCDVGWPGAQGDPDRMAELFAEDGVWETDLHGAFVGRKVIRDLCARMFTAAVMSVHIPTNPKIEVDGDHARGHWTGWNPIVKVDNGAMWICGRYVCEFKRVQGEWKIAHLKFLTAFQTPYNEDFGRTRVKLNPLPTGQHAAN